MFLLVQVLGKTQPQQQPTGQERSTRGSDVKMVNTRQAQRLSDGEERAEVLRQRERKITHIMAYVAYNAKFQHAILIYNT